MKAYNTILSVKVNKDVLEKIDCYSNIEEISRSGLVRRAIRQFINRPDVRQKLNMEPIDFILSR
jgi:metal-responsive CopG/Arc/MetJ family transcriptional regulator